LLSVFGRYIDRDVTEEDAGVMPVRVEVEFGVKGNFYDNVK
jgi:hypothetical protein